MKRYTKSSYPFQLNFADVVQGQKYKTVSDTSRLNKEEYGEISPEISKLNTCADRNKFQNRENIFEAKDAIATGEASKK